MLTVPFHLLEVLCDWPPDAKRVGSFAWSYCVVSSAAVTVWAVEHWCGMAFTLSVLRHEFRRFNRLYRRRRSARRGTSQHDETRTRTALARRNARIEIINIYENWAVSMFASNYDEKRADQDIQGCKFAKYFANLLTRGAATSCTNYARSGYHGTVCVCRYMPHVSDGRFCTQWGRATTRPTDDVAADKEFEVLVFGSIPLFTEATESLTILQLVYYGVISVILGCRLRLGLLTCRLFVYSNIK